MCQNAEKTAGALMVSIRPTVVSFMTVEGVSAAEQTEVLATYDAAQNAVSNWQPGTGAQTVIELLNAFTQVFDTLPVPQSDIVLANLIEAGIVTVIGVLTANSPAPPNTTTEATATPEEMQAAHASMVAHDTVVKIHKLAPGIKLSKFHSASHQYTEAWNKQVEAIGGRYTALKVA